MPLRNFVAAAVLFLVAAVMVAPVSAQDTTAPKWPTTEFDVWTTKLIWVESENSSLADMVKTIDLTEKQQVAIEQAMQKIAEYYQAQGFRAPFLNREMFGDKYTIHVVDIQRGRGGAYYKKCDKDPTFQPEIVLEFYGGDKPMFRGDSARLSDGQFALFAHELFHAIQRSYPVPDDLNCYWDGWIIEGTARAMGHHVAEVFTNVNWSDYSYDYYLGLRPYHESLRASPDRNVERNGADPNFYATASFWRFLAEQYKTKDRLRALKDPGAKGRDFRYLHKFFETKPKRIGSSSGNSPEEAETIKWLDASLRLHFRTTLPYLYADFVTSFAAYIPERIELSTVTPRTWRKKVFGSCAEVALSEENPLAYTSLSFEAVASRCVQIQSTTKDKVQLVLVGRGLGPSPAKKALAGMSVGVPGTSQIRQADLFQMGGPDQPGALPPDRFGDFGGHDVMASWTVCFDPQADDVIIIANASGAGSDQLHKGDVEFAIMHADWYASLSDVGPQMGKATLMRDCDGQLKKSHTAQAESGAKTDRQKAYDKADADLASVSTRTMSAASVGRSPNENPCGQPFQWTACGPKTRVSLRLAPGTFGDLGATSGRGGMFAQMTGMLEASGKAVLDGSYGNWVEQVTQVPGHEIGLHFPLIDYGFTGSFLNAYITAQMPGEKVLESIGPTDAIPGRGTRFPLNGTVTITEYSPEIMRGSFTGTMVYREDHDPSSPNEQQTLPVRHELKGDFVVAAPILNDRRTRRLDPREHQDFLADLELLFPGLQDLAETGVPSGGYSSVSDPASGMSATASNARRCDCSCNYNASASTVCSRWCEPVYKACEGKPIKVRSNPDAMTPGNAQQAIEELREAVRKRTLERFGEGSVDRIMTMFDAMPDTLAGKKTWSYQMFPELRP